MWRRRLCYGAALAAALLLQIFYDRYLARFVLAGVVSMPILSLLLTLPSVFRLRLSLTADSPEMVRGTDCRWHLRVERPPLPAMTRLKLRLRFENQLTGWSGETRVVCFGPPRERTFPVETEHCGRVTCRAARVRLLDCLGLFWLPVRRPDPASVLVLPQPVPLSELPLPELPEPLAAGRDRTRGEDYELREYRPGDPIRDIHWKLSSKRGELVVRERQGESRPLVVLEVERFGEPPRLDRVLGRLHGLSLELLERGWPHFVRWQEGEEFPTFAVHDRASLMACLDVLLSAPAPAVGAEWPGDLGRPPLRPASPGEGEESLPRVRVTDGEEGEP